MKRLPNYWLTKLFKFRRAILNLKKCIIKVITLKSAAAVTMRKVGVWLGRKVLDSGLLFFFLIFQCLPVGALHADFQRSQANTLRLFM